MLLLLQLIIVEYAVQIGIKYGHGSYFARDFKYSATYGSSTIFYVKVVTGKFVLGDHKIKVAPTIDGVKVDSVVNNMADPSIFVVFSDNHAYPAYLITYKKL